MAQEHFRDWLADPSGRDQLVLYRQDDVQVGWHNKSGPPETAHERNVSLFVVTTNSRDGGLIFLLL